MMKDDKLTPLHKVSIIIGEFILTPLLGAVMYYIWRRNYPSCARFANISSWCVLGCLLMAGSTLRLIRSSPTIIKANEIARVHPSEQTAIKALYEGIEGMEIEEDGHISAVGYSPINIFGPVVSDAETEHLAKLRELRFLSLPPINKITDLGLRNLALLTKLEILQLGMSSEITEAGIENLKSLRNLQALGIPGAAITDRSIEHLSKLTELRQIDLTGSKVGDDGVKHIEGLVKLETLALVSTQVTDVSMEMLSRLPMLGDLDVRGCNITDAGLESLSRSPQLTKLIAFQTINGGGKITDEGIKHLANIKTLKYVDISGNLVTEIGVNALREALPDCEVETRGANYSRKSPTIRSDQLGTDSPESLESESTLAEAQPKEIVLESITNSIGMKLVLIPKGTFQMGSPIEDEGANDDEQQHQVTISKDYYLGVTEVTQGHYEKVMGTNPSYFQKRVIRESDSSMYPVEHVSWEDAVEFCKKLSDLPDEKKAGRVYRLPTEAEWEYACRAGSKTAYSFGASSKSLGDYAWFGNNSGSKELDSAALWARMKNNLPEYSDTVLSAGCATHPVGEKKPNAWGLYDMHGNDWEWCSDWYGEYPKGSVSDPSGPKEGLKRVIRGSSWALRAAFCRSANRGLFIPSIRNYDFGFRLALSPSGIPMAAIARGQDANQLAEITVEQACEMVAKAKGQLINLDKVKSLPKGAAEELAKHEGPLTLNGLATLSMEATEALAKHEGDLTLKGLLTPSREVAARLGEHKGMVFLRHGCILPNHGLISCQTVGNAKVVETKKSDGAMLKVVDAVPQFFFRDATSKEFSILGPKMEESHTAETGGGYRDERRSVCWSFSPEGLLLAVGRGYKLREEDELFESKGQIEVWEVATGKLLVSVRGTGLGAVESVGFSEVGQTVFYRAGTYRNE